MSKPIAFVRLNGAMKFYYSSDPVSPNTPNGIQRILDTLSVAGDEAEGIEAIEVSIRVAGDEVLNIYFNGEQLGYQWVRRICQETSVFQAGLLGYTEEHRIDEDLARFTSDVMVING